MTIRQKINMGITTLLLAAFGFAFTGFIEATPVNAQAAQMQACEGSGGTPVDANGNEVSNPRNFASCANNSGFSVEGIVGSVLDVLFYVVGVASIIMLIIGGIRYVVSGGDQNAVSGAKNTILYAIVGLVVAFAAFAISNFVINTIGGTPPSEAGGNGGQNDDQSVVTRVIA